MDSNLQTLLDEIRAERDAQLRGLGDQISRLERILHENTFPRGPWSVVEEADYARDGSPRAWREIRDGAGEMVAWLPYGRRCEADLFARAPAIRDLLGMIQRITQGPFESAAEAYRRLDAIAALLKEAAGLANPS